MTTYKKKKLKDREGNYIVTPSSADIVYCQDGSTLEQKLNNIENDEFSPTITQVESMAKVGVGTDVDVSANVQDGYAKSAILKGNTKVNLIQESSSQDVVLPYEFTEEGQYVTINDTKETGAVGVELKGQTLVNLVKSSQTITLSSNMSHPYGLIYKMKPLTTYTIFVTFSNNVATSNTALDIFLVQTLMSPNINISASEAKGIVKRKFTTLETVPEILIIGARSSFQGTVDVDNIMILEGDYTNVDIPYFEGMQSVQVPSVKTVGKNLLNPSNLVDGIYNFTDGVFMESSEHLTTKTKIQIKPSTAYVLSYESETFKNYWFYQYDKNGKHIKSNEVASGKITTNENAQYIQVAFLKGNSTSKFQLEESSTPTTYEPYKSTTLTLPEEITLRGIGNVKDTLNTVTGEYVQCIGEVVLDGSENWTSNSLETNDTHVKISIGKYPSDMKQNIGTDYTQIICDKLPSMQDMASAGNCDFISTASFSGYSLILNISKTKLNSYNVAGIKEYLTSNNLIVQYPLETPITKKLDLTFTDQDNAPTTKLSTYNTATHINASSKEGSLIPILSHINPSYPVILKPSTKYSIVADSYSNDHTNSPINFNLGGATVSTTVGNRVSTVTTPSTLTSEKLTMSGRGNMLNNVMVIEGDVVGDEVYFEGMCDVKSYKTLTSHYSAKDVAITNVILNLDTPIEINHKVLAIVDYEIIGNDFNGVTCMIKDSGGINITGTHNGDIPNGRNVVKKVLTVTTKAEKILPVWKRSGEATGVIHSMMVLPYQEGMENWDIPYFEGAANIQRPMVTNVGKNLFDGELEIGTISNGVNASSTLNFRSKDFMPINGDKVVSWKAFNENYLIQLMHCYDKNKIFIQTVSNKTKTPTNATYCKLVGRRSDSSVITDISNIKIQLEYSTETPTTYEPYKSNILLCNSEVVLRSLPNGICDTLDLMTGEYVQRIGEVVLDGSEDESWGYDVTNDKANTKLYTFAYDSVAKTKDTTIDVNCNRLSTYITNTLVSGDNIGVASRRTGTNGILVRHSSTTLTNFKTYLQQNPITVQYELATPITTTIDLVPSGTNPTTKPFVWKDGHVQLLSEQGTLTPSLEYSVITSRGGQILDNTRQIAKQDKRIYDLEMLLISSSVEDAYQRLALQNSVQMLSYNEELKVNPIRYYMLSRLIEEGMYQENDILNKLDAFFLYGEINTDQYYGLAKSIVGDNAIVTLDEVLASHEIQVDIPTTLEELPADKPTTLEEEVLPSDIPTTLEEQPIIDEVEEAPVVELKEYSKTYTLLMNKLELSIQRVEDLAHYVDLANAYVCANRLSYEEYELVIARIENAYISLH